MSDVDQEHFLFVIRLMQFCNIYTIYSDFLTGHYKPSVGGRSIEQVAEVDASFPAEMLPTLMYLLYAFFYSLVDSDSQSLNAFRIWREKYGEEEEAIAAMEAVVQPLLPNLKTFRNRLCFHGSRTRERQDEGLVFFGTHSGDHTLEVIKAFKALNAALLSKNLSLQSGSQEEQRAAREYIDATIARCRALQRSSISKSQHSEPKQP